MYTIVYTLIQGLIQGNRAILVLIHSIYSIKLIHSIHSGVIILTYLLYVN